MYLLLRERIDGPKTKGSKACEAHSMIPKHKTQPRLTQLTQPRLTQFRV